MSKQSDEIEEVLIVGGGDIGLTTGLCIRKLNPDLKISVIDNFKEDPPEVGKSTYQDIVSILHGFLDIPEDKFLSEVKPLWKASVFFEDWCGLDPFHYPFDEESKYPNINTPKAAEKYYLHYDEINADPEYKTINELMVEEQKSSMYFSPRNGRYSRYSARAYHLDLTRFNSFLASFCEERDVTLVDDTISAVDTNGNSIENIQSDSETYEADLYIDASGFNRVLKGEQDNSFRDFDLPLDSAYHTKVQRPLSDAIPATVVESGKHGWFWQIDTFDFRDRGYVYASNFVSDEDAALEFIDHCDADVTESDLQKYEFRSGYYKNTWQENCVTIGNAAGFVEPLQSTGLTANAKAAAGLSNLLSAQARIDDRGAKRSYNAWVQRLWESIYDFISVHYKYSPGDTQFWEAMRAIPVSQRVERISEHFNQCGYDTQIDPVENPSDGNDTLVNLLIFPVQSYYTIMRNMGVESRFYEENTFQVTDDVKDGMSESYRIMDEKAEQLLTIEEVYKGVLSHTNNLTGR